MMDRNDTCILENEQRQFFVIVGPLYTYKYGDLKNYWAAGLAEVTMFTNEGYLLNYSLKVVYRSTIKWWQWRLTIIIKQQ